jgi:hypothetical protein
MGEGVSTEPNPFWIIRERAQQLLYDIEGLTGSVRPDPASIIEAVRLRGVIQRTGPREFELRAYLQDLDWEDTFWGRLEVVAKAHDHEPRPAGIPEQGRLADKRPTSPDAESGSGGGEDRDEEEDDDPAYGWWEFRSPLIVHVRVSEFALVSVKATWVDPLRLPDWASIRHAFIDTLEELENGGLSDLFA